MNPYEKVNGGPAQHNTHEYTEIPEEEKETWAFVPW